MQNERVPVEPQAAATIVLLRDGEAGMEVLLLRRSRSAGFVPGGTEIVSFVVGGRFDSPPGSRVVRVDPEDLLEHRDGTIKLREIVEALRFIKKATDLLDLADVLGSEGGIEANRIVNLFPHLFRRRVVRRDVVSENGLEESVGLFHVASFGQLPGLLDRRLGQTFGGCHLELSCPRPSREEFMSCAKLPDRLGVISQTVSLIPGDQGLLRFLGVLGATLDLPLHHAGRLSGERIHERETADRY